MIEISIYTKENEKDYKYTKKIIDGVDNVNDAFKLLPEPIKEIYNIWKQCGIYRNKSENLLASMEIIFNDLRFYFADFYWD